MNLFGPCTSTAVMAAAGIFVLVGVLLVFLFTRGTIPVYRRHPWWAMLAGAALVGLAAGGAGLAGTTCRPVPVVCRGIDYSGRTNLLPNAALAAPPGAAAPTSWVLSGTLGSDVPAGAVAPAPGTDLTAAHVRVQPGATYCYDVDLAGTGHGQVLLLWDAATFQQVGYSALPPVSTGGALRGAFTAPSGAAYVRLMLRSIDGAPQFAHPALAQAGVRVESWPNGAAAALAFSFDWESAMGGLIHSKSGHDVQYAVNRGMNMRAGADTLLSLFQQHNIQATFYATGYNLIDGNTSHTQFAGNPLYKWGPPEGWATTWWYTNTWYSDDPYGTVATDPAWYFGDQTDRLAAAGQEIATHTFGHLYVRGTQVDELSADLDAWAAAAAARGLPPMRSFAFPWQSSNSLTPDFYKVMAQHGITSVTRLYPPDLCRNAAQCDFFVVRASPVYSPMLVLPDFQLGVTGPDVGEGGYHVVTDTTRAEALLAEVIDRRGATSFWNHPEVLTQPDVLQTWQQTIAAAAQARDHGDLWIAPVTPLTTRWRDTGQVTVTSTTTNGRMELSVHNGAPDALDGVTLTLPQPAASVRIGGNVVAQQRPEQIVLPHLDAGQTLPVEVTPRGGGAAP